MTKRIPALLSAAALTLTMASCSKENKYLKDDPYCFLPDGVSLDSSAENPAVKLKTDKNGYIEDDPIGVRFKLPDGCQAYLIEKSSQIYPRIIIVTNSDFPNENDYVMISAYTNTSYSWQTYENSKGFSSKNEYNSAIADDLRNYTEFMAESEDIYCYDYTDAAGEEDKTEYSENITPPKDCRLIASSHLTTPIKTSPDNEHSEPETDFKTFGSRYAVQINYSQTRYSVESDKEVYWLADPDGVTAKRIEFSNGGKSKNQFDAEGFIENLECYIPENWSGGLGNGEFVILTEEELAAMSEAESEAGADESDISDEQG